MPSNFWGQWIEPDPGAETILLRQAAQYLLKSLAKHATDFGLQATNEAVEQVLTASAKRLRAR